VPVQLRHVAGVIALDNLLALAGPVPDDLMPVRVVVQGPSVCIEQIVERQPDGLSDVLGGTIVGVAPEQDTLVPDSDGEVQIVAVVAGALCS
jgi:hypothetical protein